jgi:drug/metabolite transporter (DMT)-like permease
MDAKRFADTASTRASTGDHVAWGVGLIVGAVFLLSLADASVKYFSHRLPIWQLFLLVSCISVPVLGAWLLVAIKRQRLAIRSVGWIAVRSLLLLLTWIAYYAALPLIPFSVAAVAIYTTPLFIAVFAACFSRERLGALGWVAVCIGFVGVATVLHPGAGAFSAAVLLPVLGAVSYAVAMVVTRLHCREEHPLVLAFGLNVAFLLAACEGGLGSALSPQLAAGAPFLLSAWQSIGWPEAVFVMGYAIALVAINTATARAYQLAPAAIVGTFDYMYLIFACLWGYWFFAEIPESRTWVGMALILLAGLMVTRV